MVPWRAAIVCAMLGATPAAAAAQSVSGVVVGRSNVPMAGVVVQLIDSASRVANRTLTNAKGEFALSAPRAGPYRLRTLRIGFRPFTSRVLVLRTGDAVTERVALEGTAVGLDTIRVVSDPLCRVAGDSTATTFAVWEQARMALTATQMTADDGAVIATVVVFERTLDRNAQRVRQQASEIRTGLTGQPWQSLPPAALSRMGYVLADSTGLTYNAPSIDVLLSPEFIRDHCFRLTTATDSGRAGMIGISFEPTPARSRIPEIAGTLWLDRASSELRGMNYRYVNVTFTQGARAPSGGEMELVRLRNGAWAISSWNIRMPVFARPEATASVVFGSAAIEVTAVHVTGGELALATLGADTLWARQPLQISGTVNDSLTGTSVSGARLRLQGTAVEGVSDASGRFTIDGVLPGEYTLEVRSSSLDSVGAVYQSTLAVLGPTSTIRVRVPSADQIAGTICGKTAQDARAGFGMVVGYVGTRGDSVTPGASVVAEWAERSPGSGERRWVEAATDARGMFRLCGLPLNTPLVIRAATDSSMSPPIDLRIPGNRRFTRTELTLDVALKPDASFSGHVFVDSTRQPIAGAEVAFPDLDQRSVTNGLGAFRLIGIPPGTHRVLIRRIGYGPVDTSLTFRIREKVERQVFLERITSLDSMLVTARASDQPMIDFAENRRVGLGHFLTRDELAKQEGRRLSEVIAQLPGLVVNDAASGGNSSWIASSRGRRSLSQPCVQLEGGSSTALQKCGFCYAAVYLDNVVIYRGGEGSVPDINTFPPHQIEAVEYYASAAQTPMKYSTLNSACGVLVIHTRRPDKR